MTSAWLDANLVCPACAGEVTRKSAGYFCAACAKEYLIRYGIPDFRLQPDPYITIEHEMWKIDGFNAPGRSFEDMVRAYYVLTPESPPELHSRYIDSMAAAITRGSGMLRKLRGRYSGLHVRDLLDLGCGTGGMSIAASRAGLRVVGVDVALR